MELAIIVDREAHFLRERTVLTLLSLGVCLQTLAHHVMNVLIKGIVLSVRNFTFVFIDAIRAFLIRSVVALDFRWADRRCLANAVWTLRG